MDNQTRSVRAYRARAAQLRAEAEAMPHPETRKALLEIAVNFEQLANRVEKSRLSS